MAEGPGRREERRDEREIRRDDREERRDDREERRDDIREPDAEPKPTPPEGGANLS